MLALRRAKAGLPRISAMSMADRATCTAEQCAAVGMPAFYAGKPVRDALESLEAAAKVQRRRLAKVVVLAARDKREVAARIFNTQADEGAIASCTWLCLALSSWRHSCSTLTCRPWECRDLGPRQGRQQRGAQCGAQK